MTGKIYALTACRQFVPQALCQSEERPSRSNFPLSRTFSQVLETPIFEVLDGIEYIDGIRLRYATQNHLEIRF